MAEPHIARFLRLPAVINCTGLGRDTIYRMVRKGEFPRPVKISERASGWLLSEVDAFIQSRAAERCQPEVRKVAG